jgi:hypothetical protein
MANLSRIYLLEFFKYLNNFIGKLLPGKPEKFKLYERQIKDQKIIDADRIAD